MARSVIINGTTYNNVPRIAVPLSTGNGNASFYDTSDADIAAQYVLQGYVGYGPSGKVTGTMTAATVSQDGITGVLTIA